MPHSRLHPLPRFTRFPLTLLLYGLLGVGLGGVSSAQNLTVSSGFPRIFFDDTNTAPNPDWQIIADQIGVRVFDPVNTRTPFGIRAGAPGSSLWINNNGNVGLGTLFPAQKLHVVGGATPSIRIEQDGSLGSPGYNWDLRANHLNFFLHDVTQNTNSALAAPLVIDAGSPTYGIYLNKSGKLGLSTSNPQGNLHIFGAANKDIFNGMGPDLSAGPAFNFGYSGNSFGPGTGFFNVRGANSGVNPSLRFATANVQRLIVTNAGRVGIGTLAPSVALDVVGTVRASTSLMVGGQTLNVPDYVFEADYQLMPLTELGSYVAREKHLPDIPSAQEIKEQGVNLSELQMQLLKKVEELTLYAVEQERINKAQEQTITAQATTIQDLKNVLVDLTARLAAIEQEKKK